MTTSLISPTVPADDSQKVNAILSGVEQHLGFVPDGLRLYSMSPPLLEAFVGNVGYFMSHPRLSQELLASIRYLVSTRANCSFCIDFNAGILMNLGKSEEDLAAARQDPDKAPLGDEEKLLLKIALRAIDAPEGITEADLQAAVAAGFSERDVFDAVVAAANNRALTHVLRTFKIEHQGAFA